MENLKQKNTRQIIADERNKKLEFKESAAEEITLMTGLKAKVVNNSIEVDTIVGIIEFNPWNTEDLMVAVYLFISRYGSKLEKYGIEQAISIQREELKRKKIHDKKEEL